MVDDTNLPEGLIDRLVADVRPVNVTSARRLAFHFGLALVLPAVAFLALFGLRDRLLEVIAHPDFILSFIAPGVGVFLGCLLMARSARPGLEPARAIRSMFATALGSALVVQLMRFGLAVHADTWGPALTRGWVCLSLTIGMSAVMGGVALVQLRHQAPVRPIRAGAYALLSASAMGGLVLQFHCPNDSPVHQLLWHLLLPGVLLGALSVPASRKLLRW